MPMRLVEEADRESLAEMYGVHGFSNRRIPQTLLPREPAKRRRTEGLNSRFDRMIETVNVVHSADEPRRKRRRTASTTSGSSSLAGWDPPKTPLDAYTDLDGGRLGENFSVLKMNRPGDAGETAMPEEFPWQVPIYEPVPRNSDEDSQVPPWLSDTVSTLQSQHPLRDLIPAPPGNAGRVSQQEPHVYALPAQPSARDLPQVIRNPHREEEVFAFRPPTATFQAQPPAIPNHPFPDYNGVTTMITASPGAYGIEVAEPTSSHLLPPEYRQPSMSPQEAIDEEFAEDFPSIVPGPFRPASTAQPISPYVEAFPINSNIEPSELLPFSTPGPLARQAKPPLLSARFALSPAASASARLPTIEHVPALDEPLPFSKPGPLASAINHKERQPPIPLPVLSTNPAPIYPKLLTPARELTPNSDTSERFSLSDLLRSDSASSPAPAPPRPIALPRPSSTLVTPQSRGAFTDVRGPFRTPEPTHIYFDPPTEDPISSDPLDAADYELELDYANLDFCWEKFDPAAPSHTRLPSSEDFDVDSIDNVYPPIQSNVRPGSTLQAIVSKSLKPPPESSGSNAVEQRHNDTDSQQPNSQPPPISAPITNQGPVKASTPGADRKIAASSDKRETSDLPPTHRSPTPEAPDEVEDAMQGIAFAPAPGIYISPLRKQGSIPRGDSQTQDDEETRRSSIGREESPDYAMVRTPELPSRTEEQPQAPRPPVLRRLRPPGAPTPPPIAVLKEQSSIEDPGDDDPSLSQTSHDTIESWSVA